MKKIFFILFFAFMITISAAPLSLYGISGNQLIMVNPLQPGNSLVVATLNIPGSEYANSLAYDPVSDSLFALTYVGSVYYWNKINRHTGQVTRVANLGDAAVVGYYEAMDYVNHLGKFVVSRGVSSNKYLTSEIYTLDTNGNLALHVNNGLDNDYGVYDSNRQMFYFTDPNGHASLIKTDLTTGANTNLGAFSIGGDMAFNPNDGYIYGMSGSNLMRVSTTAGGAPISVTDLGSTGYSFYVMAFAPTIPEPSSWTLLCITVFAVARFLKKK